MFSPAGPLPPVSSCAAPTCHSSVSHCLPPRAPSAPTWVSAGWPTTPVFASSDPSAWEMLIAMRLALGNYPSSFLGYQTLLPGGLRHPSGSLACLDISMSCPGHGLPVLVCTAAPASHWWPTGVCCVSRTQREGSSCVGPHNVPRKGEEVNLTGVQLVRRKRGCS